VPDLHCSPATRELAIPCIGMGVNSVFGVGTYRLTRVFPILNGAKVGSAVVGQSRLRQEQHAAEVSLFAHPLPGRVAASLPLDCEILTKMAAQSRRTWPRDTIVFTRSHRAASGQLQTISAGY